MSDVLISKLQKGAYHEPWCPYAKRIRQGQKRSLPEEKAKRKGYCECKFCHSVRGIVYKYRSNPQIEQEISYDSIDDAFCVKTDFGFWKLVWREYKQQWILFHMNHRGWDSFDKDIPAKQLMRGSFHRQFDFEATSSISKALRYIIDHDKNYGIAETNIRQMPKATPKQRHYYRIQKKRKRREEVKNVYRIFDSLKGE